MQRKFLSDLLLWTRSLHIIRFLHIHLVKTCKRAQLGEPYITSNIPNDVDPKRLVTVVKHRHLPVDITLRVTSVVQATVSVPVVHSSLLLALAVAAARLW